MAYKRQMDAERLKVLDQLTAQRKSFTWAMGRDCLVTGCEDLIPAISLPDPDDRHVLAAAIRAGAEVIVTYSLRSCFSP